LDNALNHVYDYTDKKTWDLICEGDTQGVFQMESNLVRHWVKLIKPENLWELSAVVAIVRPGALQSGFADDYVEYKSGQREFETFGHPIIDEIFKSTHNVLLYQESLMSLGTRLAWSHLPEKEKKINVDVLRKAVGKKNQKKIIEIGNLFIEGCSHNGVDKEVAHKLFEIIKNSGRYLFNLSHSFKYGKVAFETAYLKANHPLEFFTVYLSLNREQQPSHKRQENLVNLINNAKKNKIHIASPRLENRNPEFLFDKDSETIYWGFNSVKFVSAAFIDIISKGGPDVKTFKDLIELLITDKFGHKLDSRCCESLICTGAFSSFKISRKALMNIYGFFRRLTEREIAYILANNETITQESLAGVIEDCIKNCSKGKRKAILAAELSHVDFFERSQASWIEEQEKEFLGYPVSLTRLDDKPQGNMSCLEASQITHKGETAIIAGIINEVKHTETKKGKNPGQKMAIIDISDDSGKIHGIPIFPNVYEVSGQFLITNNTILLHLYRGDNGWIANGLEQI
jgi:DNA polymerase-3 subunit alpha